MAMSALQMTGVVLRQEWSGESPRAVTLTVKLTPLASDTDSSVFLAAVAARALKGDSVVLVDVTEGDDAADVEALLNP